MWRTCWQTEMHNLQFKRKQYAIMHSRNKFCTQFKHVKSWLKNNCSSQFLKNISTKQEVNLILTYTQGSKQFLGQDRWLTVREEGLKDIVCKGEGHYGLGSRSNDNQVTLVNKTHFIHTGCMFIGHFIKCWHLNSHSQCPCILENYAFNLCSVYEAGLTQTFISKQFKSTPLIRPNLLLW